MHEGEEQGTERPEENDGSLHEENTAQPPIAGELKPGTAKEHAIIMSVAVRHATDPAPGVAAQGAGHMIAAEVLLNTNVAIGTTLD